MSLHYIKHMFKFLNKKKENNNEVVKQASIEWDSQATKALEQSLSQAPVPGPLKGTVKKKLMQAAEEHARKAGHSQVSAQDLMEGMLAQMPANMRAKVEKAAKQGPNGLKNLESELKDSQ